MPEKCYPCTRTILLPMYLDYTQRTRNQHVYHARLVAGGGSCAPLRPALGRTMSQSKNQA